MASKWCLSFRRRESEGARVDDMSEEASSSNVILMRYWDSKQTETPMLMLLLLLFRYVLLNVEKSARM